MQRQQLTSYDDPAPRHLPPAHPAFGPTTNLSQAAVLELVARPALLTASLFAPTHVPEQEASASIEIKHLLATAHSLLCEHLTADQAHALLAPATRVLEAPRFGPRPPAGVALFCTVEQTVPVWLPAAPPPHVVVSHHCQIRPLLPLLQGDGPFHLLDLAQEGVRLYRGSRFSLVPIELSDAPLAGDPEAPAGSHPDGSRDADRTKDRIKGFYRRLDAYLRRMLSPPEHVPMVLAGSGNLIPLFREISDYPHLLEAGIPQHTALLSTAELHHRAWALVASRFQQGELDARERHAQLQAAGRTSQHLASVLHALSQGRVEDLFVSSQHQRWGSYDERHDRVHEHHPRLSDDDDLLNIAIIHGLAGRARIHVLPPAEMPGHGDIAATFRY